MIFHSPFGQYFAISSKFGQLTFGIQDEDSSQWSLKWKHINEIISFLGKTRDRKDSVGSTVSIFTKVDA